MPKEVKVTGSFELLEAIQRGIDNIEAAELFRPETKLHQDHYTHGMEQLKAARNFMIDVKEWMGNWTVPKYSK